MAAEAAMQKLNMARQNLTYSHCWRRDEQAILSLSRNTKAFVVKKLLRRDSDGPRSSHTQAEFKTDHCRFYDAVEPDGPPLNKSKIRAFQGQKFWCPVMGEYFWYREITAAHMVPILPW